jgi:hypothetical protein
MLKRSQSSSESLFRTTEGRPRRSPSRDPSRGVGRHPLRIRPTPCLIVSLAILTMRVPLACKPDTLHSPSTFIGAIAEGSCNACVVQSCGVEEATCALDSSCSALADCVAANAALSSLDSCYTAQTEGVPAFDALRRCVDVALCAACPACSPADAVDDSGPEGDGGDGGGTGGLGIQCVFAFEAGLPASACDSCASDACSKDSVACAPGTDCADYLICVGASVTSSALQECARAHAAGANAAGSLSRCALANCSVCT